MLLIIKEYQSHNTKLIIEALTDQNTAMLFVGEGVFYLLNDLKPGNTKWYALTDSILLFGISERIPSSVIVIDYSKWVCLTEEYEKIITLG